MEQLAPQEYASELLRAIPMIEAIEERKRREKEKRDSNYDDQEKI